MADNKETQDLVQTTKEQSESLRSIIQLMKDQQSSEQHRTRNESEERAEEKIRLARTEGLLEKILDELSGIKGSGDGGPSSGGLGKMLLGGLGILGAGAMSGIMKPLQLVMSFFGSIKTGLAPITTALRSMGLTGAAGAVGFIGKIFMPIHVIISAFQGLMSAFDSESISKKLDKDISEITNVDRLLNGLGVFLAKVVGGLIDPIFKLFGIDFSVEKLVSDGFGYIQQAISDGTKAAEQGKFTEWVGNIWDGIIDSFKVKLTSIGDTVTDSLSSVVDGFIDWIRDSDWVPDFLKSKLPMTKKREKEIEQIRSERMDKDRSSAQRGLVTTEDALKELKQREDGILQGIGVAYQRQIEMGMDPEVALYQYEKQTAQYKSQFSEERAKLLSERERYQATIDRTTPSPTSGVTTTSMSWGGIPAEAAKMESASSATGSASTGDVDTDQLLDMIGKKESGGNYNALVYGTNTPKSADLTSMTLGEVVQYQNGMISRGHASTAVGKYQFIRATLMEAAKNAGLSMNDKFSPENQDKMAMYLLERRGLSKLKRGEISDKQFAANLSKEWASIPTVSGKSFYEGIAGNKASGSYDDLLGTIRGTSSSSATPSSDITMPSTSQAPAINNQRTNLEAGSLEIALRNDEPSFKKAIEEFAFNSMGKTGSPISV